MDFETICARMRKEYHSDSRQLQVMSTLETLRVTKFMQERGITSVSEGLTKLVDYIERLTRNVHRASKKTATKRVICAVRS